MTRAQRTPRLLAPLTPAGGAVEFRLHLLLENYEASLGDLPDWLHELDLARIAPLVECCLRIGMELPACEMLDEDIKEREEQAKRRLRPPKQKPS
jgi:hypothetical protein